MVFSVYYYRCVVAYEVVKSITMLAVVVYWLGFDLNIGQHFFFLLFPVSLVTGLLFLQTIVYTWHHIHFLSMQVMWSTQVQLLP